MVILYAMKRPIYDVRPLSDAEHETLEAGLRSPDAFTLRRCQILLASADGQNAYQIATNLGCNPQTQHATPSTSSTRRAFPRRSGEAPTARTPSIGPSMRRGWKLCARCFTGAPGSSASKAACGRWRWPPYSELRGGSHQREGIWGDHPSHLGADGSALAKGQKVDHLSRPPVRKKKTKEKKAARWADGSGRRQGRLGCGFRG